MMFFSFYFFVHEQQNLRFIFICLKFIQLAIYFNFN